MKICTVYGTTCRLHLLFIITILIFILAGQGIMIGANLLALLLHEAGHLFIANRFHLPVSEIELMPFGGMMCMPLGEGMTGLRGLLLASAGICVNLFCSAFCIALPQSAFLKWFLLSNLSMLTVNLLPVLPLDGGRMLLSLLSARMGRPKAFSLLLTLGRVLAGCMLLFSLIQAFRGVYRPAGAFLGCYLLYAASQEEKHGTARYLSALYARRFRIESGTAVPVQQLCVSEQLTLFQLLPQLQPNAYHIVTVVDDAACAIIGTLHEEQLFHAAINVPNAVMKELLQISCSL